MNPLRILHHNGKLVLNQISTLRPSIAHHSANHESKHGRIRLSRLVSTENPKARLTRHFSSAFFQHRRNTLPNIFDEGTNLRIRKTARPLVVQLANSSAMGEDADDVAEGVGYRPEGMVAHGIVILDPAFMSIQKDQPILQQRSNGEILGLLKRGKGTIEIGEESARSEVLVDDCGVWEGLWGLVWGVDVEVRYLSFRTGVGAPMAFL